MLVLTNIAGAPPNTHTGSRAIRARVLGSAYRVLGAEVNTHTNDRVMCSRPTHFTMWNGVPHCGMCYVSAHWVSGS